MNKKKKKKKKQKHKTEKTALAPNATFTMKNSCRFIATD